MIKVGVVSLGCSKNQVDSEIMMNYLIQSGYVLTPQPEEADVLIVNTCGFIETAKQESIDTILEMAEYKNDKCSTLVITGCLSERYRTELAEELPEVDIILGAFEYETLPERLQERYPEQKPLHPTEVLRYGRVLSTPSHYAYLRIAEGCDNCCSFCAIPMIRGRYKSREFDDILEEARLLREQGVKEINIIAQDTTRYGLDLYQKKRLPELLEKIAEIGFEWVRILYAYPSDITDELLDIMCKHENIVKYIDMPIQHIDDRLLTRMNRRGSSANLDQLIAKIRALDSDFMIRTTFIVGFPGESDEEFDELCTFIENNPIDRAGAFIYSPEEGTVAATMDDQIDYEVAEQRLEKLMLLQKEISNKTLQKRIGKTYSVLVESFDVETGYFQGRSYAEAPDIDGSIYFQPIEGLDVPTIGMFASVTITDVDEYDLIGVAK